MKEDDTAPDCADDRTALLARFAALRAERDAGFLASACQGLERLVRDEPEWGRAWRTLGLTRLDLERYDEAREAIQRSLALAPLRWQSLLWIDLGDVEFLRYRFAAALECYRAAAAREETPGLVVARVAQATSRLVRSTEAAEAVDVLGSVEARAHELTSRGVVRDEDVMARAQHGLRYAAIHPGDEFGWHHAIQTFIDGDRFEEAEQLLTEIQTGSVGRLRWREFLAGELRLQRGEISLALEHLERAHRADPDDAAPLIYAAFAAMALDRAHAESLLRRATACCVGVQGRAWSDLADCLRSLGRFGEARDAYRRALEFDPDDASLELRLLDVERCS